jgi:hypothetical protein
MNRSISNQAFLMSDVQKRSVIHSTVCGSLEEFTSAERFATHA